MTVSARRALLDPLGLDPHEESLFFNAIVTGGGVWKTTAPHRLNDVNTCFARLYSGCTTPKIMDVGASSGLSTAEWRDDLIGRGFTPHMVATDLLVDACIKKIAPHHFVLTDRSGRILQHELDGQILRPEEFDQLHTQPKLDHIAPLFKRLAHMSLRRYYRIAERRGWNRTNVKLVSAAARSLDFLQDDVLGPPRPDFERRFDVIRVANLLNVGYFCSEDLSKAIANLKLRLNGEGAMIIVNRTHLDGINYASFCALNKFGKFQLLERMRQGSEIEDIILRA